MARRDLRGVLVLLGGKRGNECIDAQLQIRKPSMRLVNRLRARTQHLHNSAPRGAGSSHPCG